MVGMKSTLGRRGMICKELGWSLDYVEHGISYMKLQMILMDMPRFESGDKKKVVELTDDNADDIFNMLNQRMGVK
ncbi:MAG: hypothetical protein IKH61_12785 [Bacteroidales bacterium]|nr:hypothetical protein [Bacteroidales bacterium]